MIDKTIKNIRKILYKVLDGLLTAKISKKKGVLPAKIANKIFFFLYFLYMKGLDIKNGSNIS